MEEREQSIRSITLWGGLVNFLLLALKIASGLLIHSSALLADGFHSLSDLASDFIVLAGSKISHKPPDETHPYGHKRFETIASLGVGFILLLVGLGFIWSAGNAIFKGKVNYPGFLMLVVAGISVAAKEIIFFFTRKISKKTHSSSLYANAWHHRSDSLSSLAVLIGAIASLFGWGHADHAATVLVGLMIVGVSGKILYEGLIEITEHSADKESIQKIQYILDGEKEALSWHALRTRKVGGELFVDVHICVDPTLSIQHGHEICEQIEKKIKRDLIKPVNILIHLDPFKNKNNNE